MLLLTLSTALMSVTSAVVVPRTICTRKPSSKVGHYTSHLARAERAGRDFVAHPRTVRGARIGLLRGRVKIDMVVQLEQELRYQTLPRLQGQAEYQGGVRAHDVGCKRCGANTSYQPDFITNSDPLEPGWKAIMGYNEPGTW